ncbi:DJ-1/PfpI family protein [Planomonospora venezuelensis]|uniref:Putative intracellular protease/amidase n=1 Tax=Planomonospora venezuelensis TaxID=1999 RepID=A0A841DHD8_PLAVE|nr:DJ-1/PfpI family protein [Planomonospora venezuelensis]MBB5966596.1 putative intracellular protease/amidase [Planomonospora venezuelensis]GIN02226.1 putative protease YoaZ [Planomonospora venezuelensis]
MKTIYHAVYETMADWETGHATAHIRNGQFHREPGRYRLVTVGLTTGPVTTMGGLRVTPDVSIDSIEDAAMLILPGAALWDEGDELAPFARKARELLEAGVPVAAICGATAGLAREGVLDARDHTSAALPYLQMQPGYGGAEHYVDALAVTGGDLVTGTPTAPADFAREVFAKLELYTPEVLEAWYRLFAHNDASAFEKLMAESGA